MSLGIYKNPVFPGKKDLIPFLITLPGLFLTGLTIMLLSEIWDGTSSLPALNCPQTLPGWLVLLFYCLIAAYLEEIFFRYFLLTKRDVFKLKAWQMVLVSTALFSVFHIYSGIWGVLNSAISGVFLCIVFLRFKS